MDVQAEMGRTCLRGCGADLVEIISDGMEGYVERVGEMNNVAL